MAKIFRAPEIPNDKDLKGKKTIFLAGSIDMGKAREWQKEIEDELKDMDDVVIFNPRRLDFDPKAKYHEDNPYMRQQIEWELQHIELSKLVVFFFDPEGEAPITLYEHGLVSERVYKKEKASVVLCEEGYWKRANVIVNSQYYDFDIAKDFKDFLKKIKKAIK